MGTFNFLIFKSYVILIAVGYCLLLGLTSYRTKLFKPVLILASVSQIIFLIYYLKTGTYLLNHSASLTLYNEFYFYIECSWYFFSIFLLLTIFFRLLFSKTFKEQSTVIKSLLVLFIAFFSFIMVKYGLFMYILLYYGFAPLKSCRLASQYFINTLILC